MFSFFGLPEKGIFTVVASKVQAGRGRGRALQVVASGARLVDLAVASPCHKSLLKGSSSI